MQFEIVSHCVNYARLLTYQLSSLILHPPTEGHTVRYTLCYTEEDALTEEVRRFMASHSVPGLSWNWVNMPPFVLNRRAIGRNAAALATTADWVWFADVDYCFGPECFAHLARLASSAKGQLLYPKQVQATTRPGGDRLIARTPPEPAVREVPARYWKTHVDFRCAVGGVQIARGDLCRDRGYLRDHPEWQRGADTWQGCREDPVYRRSIGTRGCGIDLPEVYRIRHNEKGRFDPNLRL